MANSPMQPVDLGHQYNQEFSVPPFQLEESGAALEMDDVPLFLGRDGVRSVWLYSSQDSPGNQFKFDCCHGKKPYMACGLLGRGKVGLQG